MFLFSWCGDHRYLHSFPTRRSSDLVINETLVKKLGIKNPEEVLGRDLRISRNMWCTIVGVVKDFKTNSLREAVKPLVLAQDRKSTRLNSSHLVISYAVFCLKKKKKA